MWSQIAATIALGVAHPAVAVSPGHALVDQPVDVRVTGLPPHRAVALVATTRDRLGVGWRSRLVFESSRRGVVDTHRSMRLFWSTRPTRKSATDLPFSVPLGPAKVLIRAQIGGRSVASAVFVRRLEAAGVTATDTTLAREGFVGTYYAAPSAAPSPAVLQLGGSGGGHSGLPAGVLASHGYPTLSLAYFGEPGLPRELRRIPLEYFGKALRWLASQPSVDPRRLVMLGVSRGGEAALLTAAAFPDLVHGVISCTGGGATVLGSLPEGDAAWALGGNPIALGTPVAIERVDGPVLLFGGGRDAIVNSAGDVLALVDRAHAHGRSDIVGKVYAKAGHGIGSKIPNIPFPEHVTFPIGPGVSLVAGGTAAGNEQAAAASWPLVLRFLARLRR
jgi:dienelactone hydrolase